MTTRPLKASTHFIFWVCALFVFILTIALFKEVLLPFVLGTAVAYLLNPFVNKLGQIGIARAPASLMILGGFIILIVSFAAAISPIVFREMSQFIDDFPVYIDKFWELVTPLTNQLDQYIGYSDDETAKQFLKDNVGSALGIANITAQKIASGGMAVLDMISITIFMPIVAYFMMKEWPRVTRWVTDLIPRHSEDVAMGLLKQIDQKLSGFVRGQVTVALFLGISYAIALSLAGLKYGILIGLTSGVLSIIPMVGSAIGLIVSVCVAWFQTGELTFVALIAAIFIIGQLIEGNFLTPKLVGNSVGLHPLWVFFALLAGASLLGILGMFLAVPIAAVAGVLLSFALTKYKSSAYYQDSDKLADSNQKTKSKV